MGETLNLTPREAVEFLVPKIAALSQEAGGKRIAIGFAGGPGAGKSTIAAEIVDALNATEAGSTALVPMDGFHMKHAKIVELGFEERKGAPHTFEGADFVALLGRLKTSAERVGVPTYSRKIEDTVADGLFIDGGVKTLIVEGNYLLLGDAPWDGVKPLLDYVVFIRVDRDVVKARLMKRHGEEGLFTEERNRAHIERNDLPNYDLVDASKGRAALIIDIKTVA